VATIEPLKDIADLCLSQSLSVQGANLLVRFASRFTAMLQSSLLAAQQGQHLWIELAVAITGNTQLQQLSVAAGTPRTVAIGFVAVGTFQMHTALLLHHGPE